MRALLQRVIEASVDVVSPDTGEAHEAGRIGPGLVALVGVTHDDSLDDAERLADKIANLRIFDDDDGVMNLSLRDTGGAALIVSQFTLYGDTRKGRRPGYVDAARPEHAEPLVDAVAARIRELGVTVAEGRFRTHMRVGLVNDGPVTLLLEV